MASDVARYFGFPIPPNRHRALADVELTAGVLIELLTRGTWTGLFEVERAALMQPKRAETAAKQTGLF